jgi:hypothetical protein
VKNVRAAQEGVIARTSGGGTMSTHARAATMTRRTARTVPCGELLPTLFTPPVAGGSSSALTGSTTGGSRTSVLYYRSRFATQASRRVVSALERAPPALSVFGRVAFSGIRTLRAGPVCPTRTGAP